MGGDVTGRALYSIEETRARLGGISRNSLYAMLRAGDLSERGHNKLLGACKGRSYPVGSAIKSST